jgi:NAD(P)-dependent dehydrogenase (short-subunit alcohol dehydrogenase family)
VTVSLNELTICLKILYEQMLRELSWAGCYYAKNSPQASCRFRTKLEEGQKDMHSFANRVVLITGAGSGIGEALARRLASEGAKIAALDRVSEPLISLTRDCPGSAWAVADVTNRLSLNQAVAELTGKLGPVDILIACAGIGIQTAASTWNAAEFESVIQVNLIGVANSIAAVMPSMIQRRQGQLVALSSLASFRGIPTLAGYCASKAGVNALMDSLRCELRGKGICVTTICPGFIRTPMTAPLENTGVPLLSLDSAIEKMVQIIRKRKSFVAFPGRTAWQLRVMNHLPRWLADRAILKNTRRIPEPSQGPQG